MVVKSRTNLEERMEWTTGHAYSFPKRAHLDKNPDALIEINFAVAVAVCKKNHFLNVCFRDARRQTSGFQQVNNLEMGKSKGLNFGQ